MNTSDSPRVAVLGQGLIGSIWTGHLHDAGLLAASWNRTPKPDAPMAVATPREAAEKASVLMIVVSDPAAVESVIDAAIPSLSSRHLVIQSSTVGPSDSRRFQARVTATGARYLEAPFTGSKPAAENRKTIFYLGGDDAAIAAAEPVLSAFSALRIRCGSGEQACTVKLAMNLQIAAQTEALCEALVLCRNAGVGDDTFFEVMKNNAAWSGVTALKEPKLRDNDYRPQFAVKHMLKDLRLLKKEAGSLPSLDTVVRQLQKASESGDRDLDYIALYKRIH